MLEPTRKPHIDNDLVRLRFTGPESKKEEAVEALRKLGFEDTSDSIPWREAFPEYEDEPPFSIALRGARTKEGLTQAQLAKKAKIAQAHISKMENGKMEIGKERAKRLANVLDIDYRILL